MNSLESIWREITLRLIERGMTISTMESCTGGLIASLITDTEGASAVIKGAFVTYCNAAKVQQGVPAETIERFGVYSLETAKAMARASRSAYDADIGIGVTGTLGRLDPDNADSVSGEVYIALDHPGGSPAWALKLSPADSRRAAKYQVADELGRRLLECLPK